MNILLVYPKFPDTFWSFKHALKFVKKKVSSQPLGLLTVAAMLPATWGKKLIDLNCEELCNEDVEWADFVFVSAMSIQRESVLEIISKCNSIGTKIVAGGPLFTAEYKQFHTVDHFVLNEAELTINDFIIDVQAGIPKKVYTSPDFPDIKKSPMPLWELAHSPYYATMNIQFSRGCPFNCDFCNITTLYGNKTRTKDVSQVLKELDALYNLGWRKNIFFVDDNFIGNKSILKKELLPALIEWRKDKKGITFSTEASINLADDTELMSLMVNAGFETVFIGIETPDADSLAECNKQQNLNRNLIESVKRIQRSGMEVQGGFILGFDNDTHSTFQRLIDFIQNSGIVTAMVGLLQAPTDTSLYKRLLQEGRITSIMSGDNVVSSTNIVPVMNIETLYKGYKNVMRQLYSPVAFNKRIKTFFKEYKTPKVKLKADFKNIRKSMLALGRSIYILGILDKERQHYWRLFFWTLLKKPSMLNLSMTFAVYRYHFRLICEEHIQ